MCTFCSRLKVLCKGLNSWLYSTLSCNVIENNNLLFCLIPFNSDLAVKTGTGLRVYEQRAAIPLYAGEVEEGLLETSTGCYKTVSGVCCCRDQITKPAKSRCLFS